MWQRRRVAREGPGRGGREVGVPHRGDHDDAVRHGVRDRVRLEPGVGVAVGVERITDASEAEVDHASALIHGPADRSRFGVHRDRVAGVDDLGHEQLGRRSEAGDSDPVVHARSDDPCDEGPMTELVHARRAADEALLADHLLGELGVRRVDARVDDRDRHLLEFGERHPRLVEPALGEIPLSGNERVGRGIREMSGDDRLDVAHPRHASERERVRAGDDERRDRRKVPRSSSRSSFDRCPRKAEPRRGEEGGEDDRPSHSVTVSGGEIPSARPFVAATRAR